MPADARAAYESIALDLSGESQAVAAKMFGMPCLKIRGKAFAGFHQEAMAFKLEGEAHAQALALPGAHLFDPSGMGRPMKQWVQVPAEHSSQWGPLGRQALDYVRRAG